MESFEVIKQNGVRIDLQSAEPFIAVNSATLTTSLMGDDYIQLSVVSSIILPFEKGDYIKFLGKTYSLRNIPTRKIVSDFQYTYDLTFYGVMYDLMKTIFRDADVEGKSSTSSFDLTYSIKDFVKVIIYNTQRDYRGLWVFDEASCPETEPKTLNFSQQNCLQVLQTVCSEFNLEFQIDEQTSGLRVINIGRFGNIINAVGTSSYFEYGKGNGLYSLQESKVDDKAVISRLWFEGGTQNLPIAYRDYALRLQMPYPARLNKNQHKLEDGTIIPIGTMTIGTDDDTKRFIEDATLSKNLGGAEENAVQYKDIYPQRTGEVTAVIDRLTFEDSKMDFDLNEKDSNGTKYLINGTSAKITFVTGKLAGQEFELLAYKTSSKQFTIMEYKDERNQEFPTKHSEAFRFAVGDKYKITDIYMPQSYIDNAEEDLWFKGYEEFKQVSQPRVKYQLEFAKDYLKELADKGNTYIFNVGDYVAVKDERFNLQKNIRIQQINRNLLLDYDYSLTLADTVAINIINQTVATLIEHETVISNNRLRDINRMRYGWKTTEELRNMVYDTDGYFDTDNIRPNSIETNMLTVGSKSQQFVLNNVILEANFRADPHLFRCTKGLLLHLTIKEDSIRIWTMPEMVLQIPDDTAGFYLFAACSRLGDTAQWIVTSEQLKVEQDPNLYYFQIGIISPLREQGFFRDFTTTYGFTRINGNTITTGRIVTSDGYNYLDLDGNKFRVGNGSNFISWNGEKLVLKGTLVQSQSGDTYSIGIYRGVYDNTQSYYINDEVSYTDSDGATATYRCIKNTDEAGHNPTETEFWKILAKGVNGKDGENGKSPVAVFRGEFQNSYSTWYYGNSDRIDIVKYNGIYYKTVINVKDIIGTESFRGSLFPPDTAAGQKIWQIFGSQFDSIATGLLLTENANIAGWLFANNRMESQNGSAYLDGNDGSIMFANNRFSVDPEGKVMSCGSIINPYFVINESNYMSYILRWNLGFSILFDKCGLKVRLDLPQLGQFVLLLPLDLEYDGVECEIFNSSIEAMSLYDVVQSSTNWNAPTSIGVPRNTYVKLRCVCLESSNFPGISSPATYRTEPDGYFVRWVLLEKTTFS